MLKGVLMLVNAPVTLSISPALKLYKIDRAYRKVELRQRILANLRGIVEVRRCTVVTRFTVSPAHRTRTPHAIHAAPQPARTLPSGWLDWGRSMKRNWSVSEFEETRQAVQG